MRRLLPFILPAALVWPVAADFDAFLKPLFEQHCVQCHGKDKVKGKVNLHQLKSTKDFLAQPALIKEIIEVIDGYDMPPEDEPQLTENQREKLLIQLKAALRESTQHAQRAEPEPVRRLNRFQYNYVIRDLFGLNRDVFPLPEKMVTRHGNYLFNTPGEMPATVRAHSEALRPTGGLKGVEAYPKDLRAAHGFDNQANQLTLSPLLLEAYLRLSVSIVESPDFNEHNVGIWKTFFAEPEEGVDLKSEVEKRLGIFMTRAFRGPVEADSRKRYIDYALAKIQELGFTPGMKKAAAAVICSPLFLYRYGVSEGNANELASRLSFFLWGSAPDDELLALASQGELADPDVLKATVDRMLTDRKIERFLDSFPSQWLQIENLFGAVPDPKKYRMYNIDPERPASLHMVLEPLLLFDAVFVENRPVLELVKPEFAYHSDLLKEWYISDFTPSDELHASLLAEEQQRHTQRRQTEEKIETLHTEIEALIKPVRDRLLTAKQQKAGNPEPVDLKPIAAWEFNGDLRDSIGGLHLKAHGVVNYREGMVILNNKAWLESEKVPVDLRAKSLEAWFVLPNVNQRGGGVMTVQGEGGLFDSIVLGERQQRHWISGSNNHSRTEDFRDATPEDTGGEMLHLVMVYKEDGTTQLYRNGQPYGKPYRKGQTMFPAHRTSILFGLRHTPPGGNKHLVLSLDRARLYDRALSESEVAAANGSAHLYVSNQELLEALGTERQAKRKALEQELKKTEQALRKSPKPRDPGKIKQDVHKRYDDQWRQAARNHTFERVPINDPRYGGVITTAAIMTMTSSPKRTMPIARGAWMIEVIFNDPPPPPPNNVPPLNEDASSRNLTIREKFAKHREHPDCAGCHARLDPLGFALENFDMTGRWREQYENKRNVDASGRLIRKYDFKDIVDFKQALVEEEKRFAKAFTGHLLRFALARELEPSDALAIDRIIANTEDEKFRLKSLIREVVLSEPFREKTQEP